MSIETSSGRTPTPLARDRRWTAAESARLRQMVKNGAVDAEIAAALGRSRETVTRKRKMLGLSPGSSPACRAALLRLAVRNARKRMADESIMPERATSYTPELGQELCRRLSDGSSLRRILSDPAMPARDTVQRWRRERPEFADEYGGARQDLLEALAEEAVDKAGDATTALDATMCRAFLSALRLCGSTLAPRSARTVTPGADWTKPIRTHGPRG